MVINEKQVPTLPDHQDTAVVIVNYRTMDLTLQAVQSVISEPGVQEIVIVDNSGDGSADLLRSSIKDARAVIVEAPVNLGFGQGVNLGARHSMSPLLFALNSDALVLPGSLLRLRETLLNRDSVAVVAPAVYRNDEPELQPGAYGVFPTLKTVLLRTNRNPPETVWPDWVSGVAFMIRRHDFESVGGFDPEFHMYLEDVDLCRRIRATGKVVRRELSAGVLHVGGQSWLCSRNQMDRARRSRVIYFEKAHRSRNERLAIRFLGMAYAILRCAGLLRGRK